MKKIISITLSLIMMLSVFTSVNAANIVSTVENSDLLAISTYLGEDFDENYFCIANFDLSDGGESVTNSIMFLTIETENEETLKLKVGVLKDGSVTDAFSESTVSTSKQLSCSGPMNDNLTELFSDGNCSKICIAPLGELKQDTKVKVTLMGLPLNGTTVDTENPIEFGSVEHTFFAPVTFQNEKLAAFGTLLTKLKFGKAVSADEIALALNGAATLTEDDDKDALSTALEAEYVNIADLAKKIKEKSNVTVNDATFDGLTISMPYAGLAGVVGENATVYAPIVSEGELPEEKDRNSDKEYYALNISLGVNNAPMTTAPIIPQKVVVDLPSTFDKSVESISVIHGDKTLTANVTDGKAEFTVKSFSNFVLMGTPVSYDESEGEYAKSAKLKITMDDPESNVFTLSLAPKNGQIIKYATGGYRVGIIGADHSNTEESALENFTYELIPANGITITNEATVSPNTTSGELKAFTFIASATDRENLITAAAKSDDDIAYETGLLPIAKLVINGTGDLIISTDGLENKDNSDISKKFYMETFYDNDSTKADITDDSERFVITQKKFGVDLKIDFNLNLQEDEAGKYANNAEYINITVELKNEITGDVHTVKLGDGTDTDNVTYLPVTYNSERSLAETDDTNKVMLPAYATYSYKITGLGFRTFRGSVYLDEDKTINLWNNALTSGSKNVVADDDSTKQDITFLVGDIYMDGIVDIYDISAVTSYFGATDIDAANENVFACDLDRDGQISVQDIAWVQMSYGN